MHLQCLPCHLLVANHDCFQHLIVVDVIQVLVWKGTALHAAKNTAMSIETFEEAVTLVCAFNNSLV